VIVIAEPYARFSRTIDSTLLEPTANKLLVFAEQEIASYYDAAHRRFSVRVFVRIERGSTRTWITVSAVAGALIFYGDIRQSIDYLISDAKRVSDLVLPAVQQVLGTRDEAPAVTQRRLGVPGQLHRLFRSVEQHHLTPDEATSIAVGLLYKGEGPEVFEEVPELTEKLTEEFQEAHHRGYLAPKPQRLRESIPVIDRPRRLRSGLIARRDQKTGKIKYSTY
jgi:hypothetical protein